MTRMQVRILLASCLLAVTASAEEAGGTSSEARAACVADSVGPLRQTKTIPDCAGAEKCRDACEQGDAASCLGQAYVLELDPATAADARSFYRQACVHGLANACTNYAAAIWAGDHTGAELECAVRIFRKACAAGEHFACGMVGRVGFEAARSPEELEGVGRDLEAACRETGGFACRVLAKHIEAGDLGAADPARVRALLEQACAGGDPDACGAPESASGTFR